MNKKIMPLVLLGLLTVGTLVGCNNDETTTTTPTPTPTTPVTPDPTTPEATTPEVTTPAVVHVESVDLECDALTLYVGDTANLTVTVLPENADDKTYTLDASSEAVTIEGLTVTAASVGTATITVTTNDGAKTDSVNISVLEALPPEPEYKTIPFADETQLEEKVLSYWSEVETVEAETTDWEDGTYEIIYTANEDASWVDLQLLYKNSDLVEGQAYLLEWNLFSDVAGAIRVNGKDVEILAGDNEITVKYVCGTDTSATTALQVFFGTPDTGLLQGETLSFELPTWTETSLHTYESANWTKVAMNEPGFAPGDGDYWWFEDEPTIVTKGNPIFRTNGIVNNTPVDANYDISVNAQGTSELPTLYTEHVGLLAWYYDDNNYVVAYCDWEKDLSRDIREFQIAAMINGERKWNDLWGDNPTYAALAKPLSFDSTYKVEVRTTGTSLSVKMYFNGTAISMSTYDISHIGDADVKAGLYAAGDDTITFTNYSYTYVEPPVVVDPVEVPYTLKKAGGNPAAMTINDDGEYVINAAQSWEGNFLVKDNETVAKEFTISSTFKAVEGHPVSGERMYGFVVYWDDNNFVKVYTKYASHLTDRMAEIVIVGFIGGHDPEHWTGFHVVNVSADWHYVGQGVDTDPSHGFTFNVGYNNGVFSPNVNGVAIDGYDSGNGWLTYVDLASKFPSDIWSTPAQIGYFVSAGMDNPVTVSGISVN